jgi:hypothetical protein
VHASSLAATEVCLDKLLDRTCGGCWLQCKYETANYAPRGNYRRNGCTGRCDYNCYTGVWRCRNCRKADRTCRNTEHTYRLTDRCINLDYDYRRCGRFVCRGYGK